MYQLVHVDLKKCFSDQRCESVTNALANWNTDTRTRSTNLSRLDHFICAWCMRLPHSKVHSKDDTQIKEIIQESCQILGSQAKPNYANVARQLSEKHAIPVPYFQLRNQFLGKTKSWQASHETQQLLSSEQEKVLVDWIEYLSSTGHPLSKRTIRKKAQDLCCKKPSRNWIPLFLKRHPGIKLGKPSGLKGEHECTRGWPGSVPVGLHTFKIETLICVSNM